MYWYNSRQFNPALRFILWEIYRISLKIRTQCLLSPEALVFSGSTIKYSMLSMGGHICMHSARQTRYIQDICRILEPFWPWTPLSVHNPNSYTVQVVILRKNKLCNFRMSDKELDKKLQEKLAQLDAEMSSEGESRTSTRTREKLAEAERQLQLKTSTSTRERLAEAERQLNQRRETRTST